MARKSAGTEVAVKIDKGFAVPARSKSGKWNDIVTKMSPGDSVAFSTRRQGTPLVVAIKRNGFKAVTRSVDGGVRVWKTQPEPTA